MNDRLRQALREANGRHRSVALLMMDLDQFKEINDALGHHAGDRLLIALSRRLENVLRDADTIARLGGDEFAVLLTTDATANGALTVARKITSALEQPFELEGLSLQTNASVGIALFPEHATDPEALTKRADVAMYMAKRSSRPFAVYDPGQDRSSVRRVTLLGELRRALEFDELVLAHQPAFDLHTGEIVGTEALVRWQHPVHGLMSPGEFVDLAEVSGMIQPLTRWAIRAAIAHAQSWAHDGATPTVGVAVNLSVRNLYDAELTRWLGELLMETGFPPSLVTLEITESEVMDDPLLAVEVLGQLQRARRAHEHRRLRHGAVVAVVLEAPADRRDQDRPLVRRGHVHEHVRRDDRARHHRPRPQPRLASRRRGCRGRRDGAPAANARLRPRPGLPSLQAAVARAM